MGVPLVEPQGMVGVEGLVVSVAMAGVGAHVALVDNFGLMLAGVSISRCSWSKGGGSPLHSNLVRAPRMLSHEV